MAICLHKLATIWLIFLCDTICMVNTATCFASKCAGIGGVASGLSCFKKEAGGNFMTWPSLWSGPCRWHVDKLPGVSTRIAQIRNASILTSITSLIMDNTPIGLRAVSHSITRKDHYWQTGATGFSGFLSEVSVADDWDYSLVNPAAVTFNIANDCVVLRTPPSTPTWSKDDCGGSWNQCLCEYYAFDLSSFANLCTNSIRGLLLGTSCFKLFAGPLNYNSFTGAPAFCSAFAKDISPWHSARLAYLDDNATYQAVSDYVFNRVASSEPYIGLVGTNNTRAGWGWGFKFGASTYIVSPLTYAPPFDFSNYGTPNAYFNVARMTTSGYAVTASTTLTSFVCEFYDYPCILAPTAVSGAKAKNCEEIKLANPAAISKEYTIQVSNCSTGSSVKPFCCVKVYCDMDSFGGGWTEIQRRYDGSVDFYRTWREYSDGFWGLFGMLGEHWLGNHIISTMTQQTQYELLVVLKPFELNCSMYARYTTFKLNDACDDFRLVLGTYVPGGSLGDSLSGHSNAKFSTYDNDLDSYNYSCAQSGKGAWWYTACYASNLNGQYCNISCNPTGCSGIYGSRMVWVTARALFYAFKESYMKIRPVGSSLNAPASTAFCASIDDIPNRCPQDCQWALWSSWGSCTGSCDEGVQTRSRILLNTNASVTGAMACLSNWTSPQNETTNCTLSPCPINCTYSTTWNSWSSCSVTCDNGTMSRNKSIEVQAQFGGVACDPVEGSELADCTMTPCPINCTYDDWSPWTNCSVTCDNGTIVRTRAILIVEAYGGLACDPTLGSEYSTCANSPCPIDCGYGPWSSWSSCSVTCTEGVWTKNRSVQITPLYGGLPCDPALASITEACNLGDCDSGDEVPDVDSNVPLPVKAARTSLQTLGCLWLVGLTASVIGLFIMFRQHSFDRILHMCQEISLLAAHVIILLSVNNNWQLSKRACISSAVFVQYFFLAHFSFVLLEAVQTYTVLTNVISIGGYMNLKLNLAVGWGCPALLVLLMVGNNYGNYRAPRSCWLNMGHDISFGTLVPIAGMVISTIILVEASGMGQFKKLPMTPGPKHTTALLSRSSLLFILPLTTAAWFVGQLALYSGNVGLYSVVFVLNLCLGIAIVQFHTLQNEQVRNIIRKLLPCCKKTQGANRNEKQLPSSASTASLVHCTKSPAQPLLHELPSNGLLNNL